MLLAKQVERDRGRRPADGHTPSREHHRHERRKAQGRQRPQHYDEVQQREVERIRPAAPESLHRLHASVSPRPKARAAGRTRSTGSPGNATHRAPVQPHPLDDRRKQQWPQREPHRPARDVQGHRKALALTRKTVHERGRGRMEGRGSPSPPATSTTPSISARARQVQSRSAPRRTRPGPANRRSRGRHRSATCPNPSCDTDAAI